MPQLQIKNHQTGEQIFHGYFKSAKDCIEQAVRDNVCLDYADLRHAGLAHASLDDIVMRHARLDYANLTGANLSEAQLRGTSFAGATLYGTCFCFSSLDACNFEGSQFGGTDIAGCALPDARFSLLSAFSLNFTDAEKMENCSYQSSAGADCPLSRPPLVVRGLALPVVFMDRHLKIGSTVRTYGEWLKRASSNDLPDRTESSQNYTFFRQHQGMLRALCREGDFQAAMREARVEFA